MNIEELHKYLQDLTILYVEDNQEAQSQIFQTLRLFSNNIISASNGEKALQVFHNNKVHLIITDIEMPHLNGIELIKNIRNDDFFIPIIILTAFTSQNYLFESVNLNIQSYITKPINLTKLKEALKKIVYYLKLHENSLVSLNDLLFYDKQNGFIHTKDNEDKVSLNNKERQLLDLFLENKNQCVSYEDIEYEIWTKNGNVMTQSTLRTLVKTLRKKLNDTVTIQNSSGLGYKLTISKP